jgi:hypothetical protein
MKKFKYKVGNIIASNDGFVGLILKIEEKKRLSPYFIHWITIPSSHYTLTNLLNYLGHSKDYIENENFHKI